MSVKISSFEKDGKKIPTIELRTQSVADGHEFGFTFGLSKARLILNNMDEIARFVEENSTDTEA